MSDYATERKERITGEVRTLLRNLGVSPDGEAGQRLAAEMVTQRLEPQLGKGARDIIAARDAQRELLSEAKARGRAEGMARNVSGLEPSEREELAGNITATLLKSQEVKR